MWVVEHSKDPAMRQIARIRAARLLLAMDKADDALALLNKRDDESMNILTDEVRGDIYAVQKNYAEARKAYTKAQSENPESRVLLPILELKLSSLPRAS
jgi:predicted negative regulator of RcsB-dependent stress response